MSPPSAPRYSVGVRNQCRVRPRTTALSHGLSISALRFKKSEFFSKEQEVWSLFLQGRSTPEEKIRLVREVRTDLPNFCVLFFPSLRGKQASVASLLWLQSASTLLDTLRLENKSEPREASNSLTPSSSPGLRVRFVPGVLLFIAPLARPRVLHFAALGSTQSPQPLQPPGSRRDFATQGLAGGSRRPWERAAPLPGRVEALFVYGHR